MKRRQLEHLLRASGDILGETQFIVIGSQSILGKFPEPPEELLWSMEADLIAKNKPEKTDTLNVIGELSEFHDSYGYYVDPVSETTAILPKGWKGRLVNLPPGDTEGVRGLCLEPHDLVIAKYVAAREKDLIFTGELARRGIVSEERLLSLLEQTPVAEEVRERVRGHIARDFHAE